MPAGGLETAVSILNRQKALLHLLERMGGRATRLHVTKMAFLVKVETPGGGGDAFYDFLPYLHGPFSFLLYQEMGKLVRDGFVSEPDEKTWEMTPSGRRASLGIPPRTEHDVDACVASHGQQGTGQIVEYVYSAYPWYTIASRSGPRMERPVARPAVYTVGYEGRKIDGFLDCLLRAGIRRLVDVRRNAVARRYGFHGSTLARLCRNVGIEYAHHPQLGIASAQRATIHTEAEYATLFRTYETTTLDEGHAEVERVSSALARSPSALMCAEADPKRCHRSRLAQRVALMTGLPVVHLGLSA
jgi:uncharacterized protein (DUF488 family)